MTQRNQFADPADGGRRRAQQADRPGHRVRRVLHGEREDVFWLRQSSLTPWFPLLEQHWQDGCRNGAEL